MQVNKADFLIEVSWEVCNKVGGIYTVIESKISEVLDIYKNRYLLIGPYLHNADLQNFIEKVPPENLTKIFNTLKNHGIICHYGKWMVPGEPSVVLIDFFNFSYINNQVKTDLWNDFRIDSLGTDFYDYDYPILWGVAVGKFIEELLKTNNEKIVAQFHEWLTASALLYLKKINAKIGKVFTTHATVLGRALAMNNIDIYNNISKIKPLEEAYKFKIQAKFLTEKAAAKNADVFTVVSEITGIEARYFLDKKPDLILPNGLDTEKCPTSEEAAIKHRLHREKIREFFVYYFFPYYTFELEHTLTYFISGRYEFHNKGIDIFIEALAKLNQKLKEEKSKRTIVVFFWVPTSTLRIKPDIIENRAYYEDIKNNIEEEFPDIKNKIIRNLVSRTNNHITELFNESNLFTINNKVNRFIKNGLPPLVTHDLINENDDLIIKAFKEFNLNNTYDDRVKVIFYPIYLNGADRLLDLDYREAIMGSHLGVFPSYYEPWGYTPLETGALGVAAVTTDLGGFGRFLNQKHEQHKNPGIFVLNMFNKDRKSRVEEIFDTLYYFANLSNEDRVKNKIEAKNLTSLVDWRNLIKYYVNAHNLAIKKVFQ